jgi:hypothetical protein
VPAGCSCFSTLRACELRICQIVIYFFFSGTFDASTLLHSLDERRASHGDTTTDTLSPHRKYSDPHQSAEEARVVSSLLNTSERRSARKMRGRQKEVEHAASAACRCRLAADPGPCPSLYKTSRCRLRRVSIPRTSFAEPGVGLACLGARLFIRLCFPRVGGTIEPR